MDLSTLLLVVASELLVCAFVFMVGLPFFVRRFEAAMGQRVGAALGAAKGDILQAVEKAQDAVVVLKRESGRAMALIRHGGRDDDGDDEEPDDLAGLLDNPVVKGFLHAKGIDPEQARALMANPEGIQALIAQATGKAGPQGQTPNLGDYKHLRPL